MVTSRNLGMVTPQKSLEWLNLITCIFSGFLWLTYVFSINIFPRGEDGFLYFIHNDLSRINRLVRLIINSANEKNVRFKVRVSFFWGGRKWGGEMRSGDIEGAFSVVINKFAFMFFFQGVVFIYDSSACY